MSTIGSVSYWICRLKNGERAAVQRLWEAYFRRLVGLVRARLRSAPRSMAADEEDVALSAFHSFCDRVGRGQFPELATRDELWRLLVVITTRKALAVARQRACQKRGGGKVVGESALLLGADAGEEGLARFLGREPSPELAAQLAEDYRRMMEALGNHSLRTVALMRLEGHSAGEIGRGLGISPRSVERKLQLIRVVWERIALGEP